MMTRKALRRFAIFGAVIGAFVFIDGLVLLLTNGLGSDATPVLPVLGGSFVKTRSSGASVVILGVVIIVLTLVGRWWLGRHAETDDETGAAITGSVLAPGRRALRSADDPAPPTKITQG